LRPLRLGPPVLRRLLSEKFTGQLRPSLRGAKHDGKIEAGGDEARRIAANIAKLSKLPSRRAGAVMI
jgi:hypothetical protein